jgi:DNA-binding NarL/FixJ family response regulator
MNPPKLFTIPLNSAESRNAAFSSSPLAAQLHEEQLLLPIRRGGNKPNRRILKLAILDGHSEWRKILAHSVAQLSCQTQIDNIYCSPGTAQRGLRKKPVDILIFDPECSGVPASDFAVQNHHPLQAGKLIAVTSLKEWSFIASFINSGIIRFLSKEDFSMLQFEAVIEATNAGKCFFSPSMDQVLLDHLNLNPAGPTFNSCPVSPRQLEILILMALGKDSHQTSEILQISYNTVRSQLKKAFLKLAVHHAAHAIARLRELGFIP